MGWNIVEAVTFSIRASTFTKKLLLISSKVLRSVGLKTSVGKMQGKGWRRWVVMTIKS